MEISVDNLLMQKLEGVFDFSIISSALVLNNDNLKNEIQSKYPHISFVDNSGQGFDLVVSAAADLEATLTKVKHTLVLILSAADHRNAIFRKTEAGQLAYWPETAQRLGKNVLVFQTWKFLKPQSAYFIQQLNSDDSGHHEFHVRPGLYYTSLQEAFLKLTKNILSLSATNKPASILRASDGDYYFLRKVEIGSAKPGRRALTKAYDSVNIPLFRKLFWQNDIITVSIEPPYHNSWKKFLFYDSFDKFFWKLNFKFRGQNSFKYLNFIFDKIFGPIIRSKFFIKIWLSVFATAGEKENRPKVQDILNKTQTPMEAVYALVASKWLFRNFKNQIGIIAGTYKCELIKLLMERTEYQQYIGMESFTDYVEVPQKGAADNIEDLAKTVGEKIRNSKAKIFLVGAGSAKVGLMPLLKNYSNAIFIDVGAGIDALAGVVCQQRPYFCEWTDYRIKSYDYSKVDFMDQGNPAWDNPEYKTKFID